MSVPHYDQILKEFCRRLGTDDWKHVFSGAGLRIGQTELQLHHDAEAAPDLICARVFLGPVPSEKQEVVWHRILVDNFNVGRDGRLIFGLTPGEAHVVLTLQHSLSALMTSDAVIDWIQTTVEHSCVYWNALISQDPIDAPYGLLQKWKRVPTTQQPLDSHSYQCLIEDFCRTAGIEQRDALIQTGALKVKGIPMALRYDNVYAADRVEIRIDLGFPSELPQKQLWQGLLLNNFLLGRTGRVAFFVQPKTGHVVLAMQQELTAEATGSVLIALLTDLADEAHCYWSDVQAMLINLEGATPIGVRA